MINPTDTWTDALAKAGRAAVVFVVLAVILLTILVAVQEYRTWRFGKAMDRWEKLNCDFVLNVMTGDRVMIIRIDAEPKPEPRRGLPFSHLIRERKSH